MLAFVTRRVAMVPPALIGVSVMIFILLQVLPGDPLADLGMLVEETNLHVIMKDGAIYKNNLSK